MLCRDTKPQPIPAAAYRFTASGLLTVMIVVTFRPCERKYCSMCCLVAEPSSRITNFCVNNLRRLTAGGRTRSSDNDYLVMPAWHRVEVIGNRVSADKTDVEIRFPDHVKDCGAVIRNDRENDI